MCIAILNTPKGGLISKETLRTCWNNNRDGAGLAYHDGGKLFTFKELRKFKHFWSEYEAVRGCYPGANILLHFRIRTHGYVNEENCHPFMVHDELCFIHNGTISGFDCDKKERSDTFLFNERVLKSLPRNFVDYVGIRRLIRKVGGWSKFVFLKANGKYRIINEEGGHWVNENWYSNKSYEATYWERSYTPTTYGKMYTAKDAKQVSINYGSRYSGAGRYDANGFPKETKDEGGCRIVKPDGGIITMKDAVNQEWEELKDSTDDYFRNDGDDEGLGLWGGSTHAGWQNTSERMWCSDCYSELKDRMERHYGLCDTCLAAYNVKK